MHVNWAWIKQRPHFFIESLSSEFDVYLMHFAIYRKAHKTRESPPEFPSQVLWRVPGRLKKLSRIFQFIDAFILAFQIKLKIYLLKPDLIWVTHPEFESVVRNSSHFKIIYDCMDDHLAFDNKSYSFYAEAERRLLAKADLTVFSSDTLAARVQGRASINCVTVVNNGLPESWVDAKFLNRGASENSDIFVLGYYGTISHWFDWEAIQLILQAIPSVYIYLAGPIEVTLPPSPRIKYFGVLNHDELLNFASSLNGLIMPFKVNSLIEAVDPVKLYEYISFRLPSFAPTYTETKRFSPFVTLYDNHLHLIDLIRSVISGKTLTKSEEEIIIFLKSNTWKRRGIKISAEIKKLINL